MHEHERVIASSGKPVALIMPLADETLKPNLHTTRNAKALGARDAQCKHVFPDRLFGIPDPLLSNANHPFVFSRRVLRLWVNVLNPDLSSFFNLIPKASLPVLDDFHYIDGFTQG
jgi:hypothetical protein